MAALEADECFLIASRVELFAPITARNFYERMGYAHRGGTKRLKAEKLYCMEKRGGAGRGQLVIERGLFMQWVSIDLIAYGI